MEVLTIIMITGIVPTMIILANGLNEALKPVI